MARRVPAFSKPAAPRINEPVQTEVIHLAVRQAGGSRLNKALSSSTEVQPGPPATQMTPQDSMLRRATEWEKTMPSSLAQLSAVARRDDHLVPGYPGQDLMRAGEIKLGDVREDGKDNGMGRIGHNRQLRSICAFYD